MNRATSTALPRGSAIAFASAALILALQAAPYLPSALEYRREMLLAQPWRLLTGHLVHINWTHALINAAAWIVIARLLADELDAKRQMLCLFLGGLFISLALAAFYSSIAWYRGASGVLHALFFAGAISRIARAVRTRSRRAILLPAALVAGGTVKVLLELPLGAATVHADWLGASTVPQAHLLGALFGAALGVLSAGTSHGRASFSG